MCVNDREYKREREREGEREREHGYGRETYPDFKAVLDFLFLLIRVVAIITHELRLQHVSSVPVQTEEGAVQLGAFIYVETYTFLWFKSLIHSCLTG